MSRRQADSRRGGCRRCRRASKQLGIPGMRTAAGCFADDFGGLTGLIHLGGPPGAPEPREKIAAKHRSNAFGDRSVSGPSWFIPTNQAPVNLIGWGE